MSSRNPVYVTRPVLPEVADLLPLLEEIWTNRILTNCGPIHQRFEMALAEHLGVQHITIVSNATLGLMLAAKHLVGNGEVITTPFSFVATAHSLLWAGATPVFADIDPTTLNLDPNQIERHITPRTKAIMAVHCYGQPCDVERINEIAKAHKLHVIYDAAHAFGVNLNGRSVLHHGDLSVLSFHATKVFNTFEGGAIVSQTAVDKLALDRLCNYGIIDELTIDTVGMNAKMSEFNAAIGLLQLKKIDSVIARRAELDGLYRDGLRDVPGIRCVGSPTRGDANYYNFPILVGPEYKSTRDALYERLRAADIFARRYFYPLISDLPMYRHMPSANPQELPVARRAADQVLCLPLYPDLTVDMVARIIEVVAKATAA